jgi:hypothetical protein
MGKMSLDIDDKVERSFREKTLRLYGHKKGALSKAAEDAFNLWNGEV